ncbi:MAG: hypothetical protein JXA37_01110 [Chloroflexia bacterium]|nr:hypothetical protein [Chloroflexia bacterium]
MERKPLNMTLEEAWQLAIRREQEARELYLSLADMATTSGMKELFLFLAEQEQGHETRLQDEYDQAFRPEW